jgi:hypothetical protein
MTIFSDDKVIISSHCGIKVWDIEFGTCLQTLNFGHSEFREIVQI